MENNENKQKVDKNKSHTKKNYVDFKKQNSLLIKENNNLKNKIKNLFEQIKNLKIQNEKNIVDFKSKASDFESKAQLSINKFKENLQKQSQKEINNIKKYSLQKFLDNILEPLINIDLAILNGKKQKNTEVQLYVKGFEMLMSTLFSEFENFHIKKIVPKVGSDFNPKFHQAIGTEKGSKNKIILVKKPGFQLHDRIIKPALVIIGQ